MQYLRQSTASQEILLGPFVDSADGVTAEDGLTISNTDIKIWKTGTTTLADKNSGGATVIGTSAWYHATLDATDTDTIGPLRINVHESGALPVILNCVVLDEAIYDQMFGTTAFATSAAVADAVWDEAQADHVTAGSFGVVASEVADILVDTAEIGAAGAGLTNINLPNQTMDITGNITGNLTGSIGSLGATAKSDVNAEVLDVLNTDTFAEPVQGTPAATASLVAKIGYLYKNWRNRKTQTATQWNLYNDDATTIDHKSTVADDGTTGSKTEIVTGP